DQPVHNPPASSTAEGTVRMRSCREIRHADLITAHDPRKLARCVATLWECLFEQGRQSAAQSDGASRCKRRAHEPGMARTGRRRIIEATKKRWAAKRTNRTGTGSKRAAAPWRRYPPCLSTCSALAVNIQ